VARKEVAKVDQDRLGQQIEKLREQMHELGGSLDQVSNEVLEISQKLDDLIVDYQKTKSRSN